MTRTSRPSAETGGPTAGAKAPRGVQGGRPVPPASVSPAGSGGTLARPSDSATPHITAGPADLTEHQLTVLYRKLDTRRVRIHRGHAHLQGWDVRRALTRIFGFGGWSDQVLELTCLREQGVVVPPSDTSEGGLRWWVTYRAQVRLIVRVPDGRTLGFWDDVSVEEASKQVTYGVAHDLASKAAVTGALKRAAVNLGDQLGISLYRKVSDDQKAAAVVLWSAAHPPKDTDLPEDTGPVDDNTTDDALVTGLMASIASADSAEELNEITRRVNDEARAGLADEWVEQLLAAAKHRYAALPRGPRPEQVAAEQDAAAEAPQIPPHIRGGRRA